jgi:hypothetical protein
MISHTLPSSILLNFFIYLINTSKQSSLEMCVILPQLCIVLRSLPRGFRSLSYVYLPKKIKCVLACLLFYPRFSRVAFVWNKQIKDSFSQNRLFSRFHIKWELKYVGVKLKLFTFFWEKILMDKVFGRKYNESAHVKSQEDFDTFYLKITFLKIWNKLIRLKRLQNTTNVTQKRDKCNVKTWQMYCKIVTSVT